MRSEYGNFDDEPTPPEEAGGGAAPGLRLLLELGPLAIFFVANARAGALWGTAIFMVAITAALAASRVIERRWPVMPLITAVFVLAMGGLTLVLQDDTFIMIKPTLVNVFFALTLLIGLAMGKALLKVAFEEAFELDDEGWRLLTLRWALFFLLLAALNEILWRNLSFDGWLKFKLFGIAPLTMVFSLSQLGLIKRHAPPTTPLEPGGEEPRLDAERSE